MNEDCNSIEPGTELGLGLGYSGEHIQGRLTKKLGVGANAGSMVDMKYVATDSLSELVWSPHKGLSLRCADSSFNDRNGFISRDAEPNHTSSALPQSITATRSSNKLVEDRVFNRSQEDVHVNNIFKRGTGTDETGKSGREEFPNVYLKQKEEPSEIGGVNIIDAGQVPVDELPAIGETNCSSFPVHTNKINEASKKRDESQLEKVECGLLIVDQIGRGRYVDCGNLAVQEDILHPLDECKPSVFHPTILGKLESPAEASLQRMNDETWGGQETRIILKESGREVRGSTQQDEKNDCKEGDDSASSASSRMHWKQRKGKEKSLSDGDVNGRKSNNEDNSCGSVESCSSAYFSTRKRRWSFEQQLFAGNKRGKKQDNNTAGSASNLGQDSSFMNWISNMMKGLSQSIQDEARSLDLTLSKPNDKHGGPDEQHVEQHVTYKKTHDPEINNTGFQSIFRSLYGPITRAKDEGVIVSWQTKQEAKEIEVINKRYDVNATPIACYGESDNCGKQLLLTNENGMEFTSGNGGTPLIAPKISSEISCGSHRSHKTSSQENRNSSNPSDKKVEAMSNSSLAKCKSNSTENFDCQSIKTNYTIGNASDPLKSLWITRFAAKTSGHMLNPENCNRNTRDESQYSMHSTRLVHCHQNHVDIHPSMEDLDTALSKEQCYTVNTEASPGHKDINFHSEQKPLGKFNSTLRLRSTEAMASDFARRLGALKHLIPSDVTENAGCETPTCFFCGKRGHHLQDCSAASGGQQQSEHCTSLAGHDGAGEMQINSGIDLNANIQLVEDRKLEGNAPMLDNTNDPNTKTDLKLDHKVSEEVESAAVSIPKCLIPKFSERSLKGSEMVNVVSFLDKQNSDMPQGLFNAVKKLQLSRIDILKCMKSQMPLSHLDGCFLRIRLGKWEEELKGNRYHVACIRGAQPAINSVSVIVRGIECQVQSQYISNHDFLEDELLAWWFVVSKDGSEVLPLAADLRAKVKKKKQLGF